MKLVSFFFLLLLLSSSFVYSAETRSGLSDDALLDTIQEHAFHYFLREAHPKTGLVKDHASNFGDDHSVRAASIAATGFALTAYPVGVKRGWMDDSSAKERTQRTLEFLLRQGASEHGFFYHFLDPETGKRSGRSELSPIDNALLFAGILFAAEYFEDAQIRDLADRIYQRADWPWMLHQGKFFALAWTPEAGFERKRWDHFDESLLMYLLAIGSRRHPISPDSWHSLTRPAGSYRDYRHIAMPPLFTHQYPHIWVDFRNQNDGHADYFKNSTQATLANRAFCIDQAAEFHSYGANSWGLTASNGPFGYRAYGAPPGWNQHDGTVAPTACGSSIVFTPKESIECLRHFYEDLGDKLWGQYGLSDAFNLDRSWFDQKVLAIDQGALLLMIENYRSELIWETMSENAALAKAKKAVGFKAGSVELPWPEPPIYEVPYRAGTIAVDGYLKDWSNPSILLTARNLESGQIADPSDASAEIRFAWDEQALYFSAKVTDDSIVLRKSGAAIWRDDALEIFADPGGDGLFWNHEKDYQIGFRPGLEGQEVQVWSWFQGGEDPSERAKVIARGFTHQKGYLIEGAIRWHWMNFRAHDGEILPLSVALHDIDQNGSEGKLQWFFRPEKEALRFNPGRLILKASQRKA